VLALADNAGLPAGVARTTADTFVVIMPSASPVVVPCTGAVPSARPALFSRMSTCAAQAPARCRVPPAGHQRMTGATRTARDAWVEMCSRVDMHCIALFQGCARRQPTLSDARLQVIL